MVECASTPGISVEPKNLYYIYWHYGLETVEIPRLCIWAPREPFADDVTLTKGMENYTCTSVHLQIMGT